MFNRNMWKIAGAKLAWSALMLITSISAYAGTTLIGGGSTTISIGYLGLNASSPTTLQFFGTSGPGLDGFQMALETVDKVVVA